MQKTILLSLLITILSCNNNSNTTGVTADTGSHTKAIDTTPAKQCYAYYQNKDTIQLQIEMEGTNFSGHLLYHLSEKDRNEGNLQGMMKGDTLIADYTFSSEGTQSVRQVAFLKQQSDLKEGFGDVEEKAGKMIFKNPGMLNFTGFLLHPSSCK